VKRKHAHYTLTCAYVCGDGSRCGKVIMNTRGATQPRPIRWGLCALHFIISKGNPQYDRERAVMRAL
jgi:hypothetical protein